MNKRILAIIGIIVIIATIFAGCSQKDEAVDATASTESTSQTVVSEESAVFDESTTIEDGSSDDSSAADATAERENGSTTTKAAAGKTTTVAKTTAKQTTKAAAQTTKSTTKAATQTATKATTKTTTKATTTVKNVSAKDVQAQVNSYIRSKGITVDSSLNPSNSGWSGRISATRQDSLNDGTSLRNCKSYVDSEIASMGTDISLYCYYDGTFFYICYMMNWG